MTDYPIWGLKTMQTRPIRNCIVPGKLTMNGDVRLVYSTEELSPVEVLMSRFTAREPKCIGTKK